MILSDVPVKACLCFFIFFLFNAAILENLIFYFNFASGGTNLQPLLLRVRRALDYQDMPWQLRYIGQPEIGEFLQI
jgi:hypothetical protein